MKLLLYKLSIVITIGGNTADLATSYGKPELNPVLASRSGAFNAQSAGIKAGIVAGDLALQHWIIKRHPESRTAWTIGNFAFGGATVAAAVRNTR